jgi:hypothetical protein
MENQTKDFSQMSNEQLLVEKKKLRNSKLLHALSIGFLADIVAFGFVTWGLSEKRHIGFLIPMAFTLFMIYKLLKKPNPNQELEDLLKARGLDGK